MRHLLLAALVALGLVGFPAAARATCGTLPYTFTNNPNGSVVDANTTNANNQFLLSCASSVDNTQVGPNGFFANQIIPTTVGQATFGGAQPYTIPTSLTVGSAGAAVNAAYEFGNASTASGSAKLTQIGASSSVIAGGIVPLVFGVADANTAWRLALDASGNLGVTGSIFSATGIFASPSGVNVGLYPGGSGTSAFTVATNGNVSAAGAMTASNGFTASNGVYASPAGTSVALYPAGSGANGFFVTTTGATTTNGNAQINGTLNTSSYIAVAGTAYMAHGTGDTYPYDAGVYNGRDHFEHTTLGPFSNATNVLSYTFRATYAATSSYQCTATNSAGTPTVQTNVSRGSAGQVSVGTSGGSYSGVYVDLICIGT